ncbi:hypothetical protein [Pseudomonas syringae]|nr:hypothetical protein [Pseudomonas syringae]
MNWWPGIYKAIDGATTKGVELELTGLGNFDTTYYGEPRNLMLTTRWDF